MRKHKKQEHDFESMVFKYAKQQMSDRVAAALDAISEMKDGGEFKNEDEILYALAPALLRTAEGNEILAGMLSVALMRLWDEKNSPSVSGAI